MQLVLPSDAAPLYRGDDGQLESFHEVRNRRLCFHKSCSLTQRALLPRGSVQLAI